MPKLPVLNSKQIIKIIKSKNFIQDHVTGSHYVFYTQPPPTRSGRVESTPKLVQFI